MARNEGEGVVNPHWPNGGWTTSAALHDRGTSGFDTAPEACLQTNRVITPHKQVPLAHPDRTRERS